LGIKKGTEVVSGSGRKFSRPKNGKLGRSLLDNLLLSCANALRPACRMITSAAPTASSTKSARSDPADPPIRKRRLAPTPSAPSGNESKSMKALLPP
jgi:hypothetical protein